MTPTQARQITLKEVIDFCEAEQKKCEETGDHWTIIGNATEPAMSKDMPIMHYFPLGTEVALTGKQRDRLIECSDGNVAYWVEPTQLENRKHLDTDKYKSLQLVIDKCTELMNTEIAVKN